MDIAHKLFRTGLVAGWILSAACYDHPTAVSPLGEDPAAVIDGSLGATTSAAVGAGQGVTVVDNFQPRLDVEFFIDGALRPGVPIAVRLEGVATDRIVGGEAVMVAPTFAAIQYVGEGERPHYPVGRELPVVAQWRLPAMVAGDTWRQTVTLNGVGEGYGSDPRNLNTPLLWS